MSIDPNTFHNVAMTSPQVMADLIQTIGFAAQLNPSLNSSPSDKINIAYLMAHYGFKMLEQCGCTIEAAIDNKNWMNGVKYETEKLHES